MMKYLLIACLFTVAQAGAQTPAVDSLIQKTSLQRTVSFLSQDSLRGRLAGSAGADYAAAFIARKFDSIGLSGWKTGANSFYDIFSDVFEDRVITAKNVVGYLAGKGTGDTVVIFSAHYDHIGQRDDLSYNKDYNAKDDIFNGANDNATGVAALLELAKYYATQANNRYGLLFIAFSGEEMGMLGSAHFVKNIKPRLVKAEINLEMLGRPVDDECFVVSFDNNAIRNLLNNRLQPYQPAGVKNFFITDPYPDEDLSERSDHYHFSRRIKRAFTIMGSSPADTYYHTVDDEYNTIDFDFLLKATRNIALACEQFTR